MSKREGGPPGGKPPKYTRSDIEELALQYFGRFEHDRLLDLLARHYYADVYRTCYLFARCSDIAEDLANETFAKAIVGIADFESKSSFFSWLNAIARNCCTDYFRRQNRHDKVVLYLHSVPDTLLGGTVDLSDYLLRKRVVHCISELKEVLRQPLKERFSNDLTFREIAMELKANEKTIQARVVTAIKLIRACVKKRGGAL